MFFMVLINDYSWVMIKSLLPLVIN